MIKPVTRPYYEQAFELKTELSFSPFIRLPIDGIETGIDGHMGLVFPYYMENFLQLAQDRGFSRTQIKRILFDVLKGIAACHSKDWVHNGKFLLSLNKKALLRIKCANPWVRTQPRCQA